MLLSTGNTNRPATSPSSGFTMDSELQSRPSARPRLPYTTVSAFAYNLDQHVTKPLDHGTLQRRRSRPRPPLKRTHSLSSSVLASSPASTSNPFFLPPPPCKETKGSGVHCRTVSSPCVKPALEAGSRGSTAVPRTVEPFFAAAEEGSEHKRRLWMFSHRLRRPWARAEQRTAHQDMRPATASSPAVSTHTPLVARDDWRTRSTSTLASSSPSLLATTTCPATPPLATHANTSAPSSVGSHADDEMEECEELHSHAVQIGGWTRFAYSPRSDYGDDEWPLHEMLYSPIPRYSAAEQDERMARFGWTKV